MIDGLSHSGRGAVGDCPACGYKNAFAVTERDGKRLFHCFAGCSQSDLLAAIKEKQPINYLQPQETHQRVNLKSSHYVQRLWRESLPADGTLVEFYLAARGLSGPIPPALRFLPSHSHKPTETRWPIMLAAVTDCAGRVQAIHRTYLTHDGKGKAPVNPAKMTLGSVGGHAVHLGNAGAVLALAEGIETALSVMQSAGIPAWSAISAGGMRQLVLPPLPLAAEVTIAADSDPVGLEAAHRAAVRFSAENRRVRIAKPPVGKDFNDIIRETA